MPTARLDPFALPSETGQRFRLLLLIATLAAYDVGTLWVYRFGPGDPSLGDIADAGLVAVALLWAGATVLYIVYQLRVPGLHGGHLSEDADQRLTARLAALDIGPSPRVLVGRDVHSSAALAYGFPWSPRILLGGALRRLLRRDPGGFDAIVRHELAHHQNNDVGKVYVARAVFWALVILAFANTGSWLIAAILDMNAASGSMLQLGSLLPELVSPAALLALAYADYAGLLRVREHYADWRAARHGSRQDLRRLLGSAASPQTVSSRRPWRLHPTTMDRLGALDHPEHAGRLDPSAMVSIGVAGAFLVGAWVGLVTDLETTRVVDTTTWDLGSIDKAISEAMAFESTLLAVALLSPMIVFWCAVVGTAAQRYWAFRTIVGQLGATSGRDLIAGVLWAGLGFGLGTAAWPTGVYALDLGDAATIGTWLVSIIIGVGVGLVVTLLSFLIVWPFVHWTLRIFRRRPPPAWFLGTTTLLACYLLALLSQLAMAVIGLIDEDREVATIVSLASAAVAVAGWRGLAALTNWRRASGPATTATAGPPNWLLAPVDG